MWVFTGIVKSSLSKSFSKFSRRHLWWRPVLSGISGLLAWNFTNTGLCQGYFSRFIQLLIKLHIVFCITLYYILSLQSSSFADLRFSWRVEFYDLRIWGTVVSSPCGVQGAMHLEDLAISSIPGFQIAFPCIIRWPNLIHS